MYQLVSSIPSLAWRPTISLLTLMIYTVQHVHVL